MNINDQKNNMCRFFPQQQVDEQDLGVINFVYETNCQKNEKNVICAVFKLCVILDGKGILGFENKKRQLKRGDVFLILPANTYFIKTTDNLIYSYVTFTSRKAYRLIENLELNKNNCFLSEREDIAAIWQQSVNAHNINVDIIAQGLLYLTLAYFGKNTKRQQNIPQAEVTAKMLKKIIDDNFNDCSFNLGVLADKLFYNRKYVSDLFKKLFHISFSSYIREIRINNAINLMNSGFSSIKEIALLSGYDDPLYFSKVFKKMTGYSPTDYIYLEEKTKKHT